MAVKTAIFGAKELSSVPSVSVVGHRHWRQITMSTRELVAPVPSSRTVQGRPVDEKNSDTGAQLSFAGVRRCPGGLGSA